MNTRDKSFEYFAIGELKKKNGSTNKVPIRRKIISHFEMIINNKVVLCNQRKVEAWYLNTWIPLMSLPRNLL